MHSEKLKRIANREKGFTYLPGDMLDEVFANWLEGEGVDKLFEDGQEVALGDFLHREHELDGDQPSRLHAEGAHPEGEDRW